MQMKLSAAAGAPPLTAADIGCVAARTRFSRLYALNSSRYLGHPYEDEAFLREVSTILQPFLQAFEYSYDDSVAKGMKVQRPAVASEAPKKVTEPSEGSKTNGTAAVQQVDAVKMKALQRIECGVHFSRRQFCVKPSSVPPLLLSFPGAGTLLR
jgi:hypothetical protein